MLVRCQLRLSRGGGYRRGLHWRIRVGAWDWVWWIWAWVVWGKRAIAEDEDALGPVAEGRGWGEWCKAFWGRRHL